MGLSLYNIILGFLALFVLLVPFTGKVYDGRYRAIKGLTIRGWLVAVAFLFSILFNYFKDRQVIKEDAKKSRIAEVEKERADSLAKERMNESNKMIINTFTHALATHGLKYDSVEKVIQKMIKDSSKKETNIIYGNHPELVVDKIELYDANDKSLHFKISYISHYSTSYHVNIKVYAMVIIKGKKYLVDNFQDVYLSDAIIPQDKKLEFTRQLDGKNDKLTDDAVFYFLFKGNFSDLKGRIFSFKTIDSYSLDSKLFGSSNEPTTNVVISFFRTKHIYY